MCTRLYCVVFLDTSTTVNVRQLKKARRKHRSFINNSAANTIVEHNGSLRNSTMADLKTVSWKLTRHVQEHIYAGAKKGWLDRVNRNASKTWGKAPAAQSLPINTTLSSSPTTAEDEASFAPVLKANNTPNDPAGAPTEATNAAETETASEKDGISTETDSTTNESS